MSFINICKHCVCTVRQTAALLFLQSRWRLMNIKLRVRETLQLDVLNIYTTPRAQLSDWPVDATHSASVEMRGVAERSRVALKAGVTCGSASASSERHAPVSKWVSLSLSIDDVMLLSVRGVLLIYLRIDYSCCFMDDVLIWRVVTFLNWQMAELFLRNARYDAVTRLASLSC